MGNLKQFLGFGEFKSMSFWRDGMAEFLGTFFLVSVQCAVPLTWGQESDSGHTIKIALAMGFIVTAMAETFGPYSGGHFNPAVSVGLLASQKCSLFRVLIYILFQCLAGVCGAAFIYSLTPEARRDNLAATLVNPEITEWEGMAIEGWLTAILVFTILGSTNSDKKVVTMATIPIGCAVALDIMTGIQYTGASMNPARSLGPAIVMGLYDGLWVYWLGPCLGAVVASVIYTYILNNNKFEGKQDKDTDNKDLEMKSNNKEERNEI